MIKVKVKTTTVVVVKESEVIEGIFKAINENGLHFSKTAVKEEIEAQRDRLWTTGDDNCVVLAEANTYVAMVLEAINDVCFSESNQLSIKKYSKFSFSFESVALGQ